MEKETLEALEAVRTLNGKVFDYFENFDMSWPLLEFRTDGFSILIEMGHHCIWNSDGDEREFYEDKNEYEPLELFLRRETQKVINQIGDIKLQIGVI